MQQQQQRALAQALHRALAQSLHVPALAGHLHGLAGSAQRPRWAVAIPRRGRVQRKLRSRAMRGIVAQAGAHKYERTLRSL